MLEIKSQRCCRAQWGRSWSVVLEVKVSQPCGRRVDTHKTYLSYIYYKLISACRLRAVHPTLFVFQDLPFYIFLCCQEFCTTCDVTQTDFKSAFA